MINRRRVMLSAVTGTALLGLAGPALAQTPAAAARNAGHYRFRVGDIQATVLSDGLLSGPPSVYAGDAPEAELRDV